MISLAGERVKETIPSLQLSYPVPVNRLTPDNKLKALTAASVNNNAEQGRGQTEEQNQSLFLILSSQ